MEDADAASSGGLEDRADVGVEVGAPEGSEAVGDLAEDDAGPQRLFRPVVGGRHRAVGQEDEQGLPEALNRVCRKRLMMRCSFSPGLVSGTILSRPSSARWSRAW